MIATVSDTCICQGWAYTRLTSTSANPLAAAFPIRKLSWSPVGLFRFSALTFNGHKIHYNEDWTRTAEGHPGVVVHGPLNVINLLDYWRDVHGSGTGPDGITYRAMSPVYAGEEYHIRTLDIREASDSQVFEVVAEKDGVVIMKASIIKRI